MYRRCNNKGHIERYCRDEPIDMDNDSEAEVAKKYLEVHKTKKNKISNIQKGGEERIEVLTLKSA